MKQVYRNEERVAAAIASSGVSREHLFLQSKLGPSEQVLMIECVCVCEKEREKSE